MGEVFFLFVSSFSIFITFEKEETEKHRIRNKIKLIFTDKLRKKKTQFFIDFQTKIVTACATTTEIYQNILKTPIFQHEMT